MTFEEVQAEHGPLVRAAVRQAVETTDAPDVEAAVWVSIWTALRHYEGRSSVKTFIYPIIKRRIADYYRERYREGKLLQAAQACAQDPPEPEVTADPSMVMPTPSELRVLRALAWGRGNEDIARELHVSKDTIRSHIKSLYRKLKFTNRGELCIFAHRFMTGGES